MPFDNLSILNEPCFQPPKGWVEGQFNIADDRVIRYGQIIPDNTPRATIVIVPGNQESMEKYFEFIHDLNPQELGYRIFIYDPFGQGESGRDLPDSKKMHSVGFGRDIADLTAFMENIVLPQHISRYPLIMIGHSKGAHFLMRYLAYSDDPVTKAVLIAPLLGINTGIVPSFIIRFLVFILYSLGFSTRYIPGAPQWQENWQIKISSDPLSSDPKRGMVRHLWSIKRAKQRMSAVTIGWLYHAFQSMDYLNQAQVLKQITIPCLMVTPLGEKVVSVARQKRAAKIMPDCRQILIPKARHDIWMERDEMRTPFIKAIKEFIS